MNVAIAWSCGWRFAWLMLAVLLCSLALQALAGQLADKLEGGLLVLLGFLPDAMATADEKGVRFAAYLGVARMLTENLPQAGLALWFSHEMKPSKFVYVNIAISLCVAAKSFITSA